jgi:hypothetical protein
MPIISPDRRLIPDDIIFKFGADSDGAIALSSGAISANGEVTGLIEGTSVHPGTVVNSLIISNTTTDGDILFLVSDGGNSTGMIHMDGDEAFLHLNGLAVVINEAWSEIARFDGGKLFINETANADMTIGLTINQGANDDEILAFKSTDVGHDVVDLAEPTTFGSFRKANATGGGLLISGFKDSDGGESSLILRAVQGEAATTTANVGAGAILYVEAAITDGQGDKTDVADGGNAIILANNGKCRFLVKGDGTLHATNVTSGSGDLDGVALDDWDDVGLVRTFQRQRLNDIGVAMSKWDNFVTANRDDLRAVGVLSSEFDFYNMQRMNDLLGGAIWQIHQRLAQVEEDNGQLRQQLTTRGVLSSGNV